MGSSNSNIKPIVSSSPDRNESTSSIIDNNNSTTTDDNLPLSMITSLTNKLTPISASNDFILKTTTSRYHNKSLKIASFVETVLNSNETDNINIQNFDKNIALK